MDFEEALKGLLPMFYEEVPGGLESAESRDKRHLLEMNETIERYCTYAAEGLQWFIERGPCREKLEKIENEQEMKKAQESMAWGNFNLGSDIGLTDEDYDALYKLASEVVKQKDFPQARGLFTMLIFLNNSYPEFWIGLAHCLKSMDKLADTEMIYKLAIFFNPLEPLTYEYYGNFLKQLNDPRADLFLEHGKEVAKP